MSEFRLKDFLNKGKVSWNNWRSSSSQRPQNDVYTVRVPREYRYVVA
jgi:hypothetical protein